MSEEPKLTKAERKALKKQQKREQQTQAEKSAQRKKWGLYGLITILVVGLGIYFYNAAVSIPEADKDKPTDQILTSDWFKGNKEAPIVIVEYSDFQCPSCAVYQPVIDDLIKTYPDKVVVAYRHFPLKQIHLQAEKAAYAAEAAGKQGKFWEMHDQLFIKQEEWAESRSASRMFNQYAEALGLDMNQFQKDIKSKTVKAAVKADYMSALKAALSATPTFYVNGERIVNPEGLEGFKQIIDSKLVEATASGMTE